MSVLKRRYDMGDQCWIAVGLTDEEGNPALAPGFVVHRFQLQHHPNKEFYVVESLEPGLFNMQIRDVYLMSDSADKPLPVARL